MICLTRHALGIAILAFFSTVGYSQTGEPSNYSELIDAQNRREFFFRKRYTYRIDCKPDRGQFGPNHKFEPSFNGMYDDLIIKGKRVLEIGAPIPGTRCTPIRSFHYMENSGEPHLPEGEVVTAWDVFDGKESRSFRRVFFNELKSANLHYYGEIFPGPRACSLQSSDPFRSSLFWGTDFTNIFYGQPPFPRDMERLKEVPISPTELENFGKGYRLGEIFFTSGPEFYELRSGGIDEFVNVEGIRYPAKGVLGSDEYPRKYELISVEPLTEFSEPFFPEWPEGTLVWDHQSNITTMHPFSEQDQKLLVDMMNEKVAPSSLVGRTNQGIFYIINSVLVIIVCGLMFRRFRQKSQ